jgi:hypothetical protein
LTCCATCTRWYGSGQRPPALTHTYTHAGTHAFTCTFVHQRVCVPAAPFFEADGALKQHINTFFFCSLRFRNSEQYTPSPILQSKYQSPFLHLSPSFPKKKKKKWNDRSICIKNEILWLNGSIANAARGFFFVAFTFSLLLLLLFLHFFLTSLVMSSALVTISH